MTDAPTALNAATALAGAGINFLEAMDAAGWDFATAEPLRDALIAYFADAQAELTVMISGAAGAQHRNAATYQEGGLSDRPSKVSRAPRPAPRPRPYVAQPTAGDGQTGEITAPTPSSERSEQMSAHPSEASAEGTAGESAPADPLFTAETAADLPHKELLRHRDRLGEIIGFYRRGGTPQDRQQYELLSEEHHSRLRARFRAEKEQKRQAVPAGAIDRAKDLLLAGGYPAEKIEELIDFYVNRRWTGLFGVTIDDDFWRREIRRHKIVSGEIPTKTTLKSRRSHAAGLTRRTDPKRLARKYWSTWDDLVGRHERAVRQGRDEQWRQEHPAQVVLLELAGEDPAELSRR